MGVNRALYSTQEYRTKSGDGSDLSVLLSTNFECVTMDKLSFLKDIHSWKWCWACGKRFMLIGLGVSIFSFFACKLKLVLL